MKQSRGALLYELCLLSETPTIGAEKPDKSAEKLGGEVSAKGNGEKQSEETVRDRHSKDCLLNILADEMLKFAENIPPNTPAEIR